MSNPPPPYPTWSLSHCDAGSRDTEQRRRTRSCRRESASNQSAQSRHAALSPHDDVAATAKMSIGGIKHGREADALCRGSSSGLAAGEECGSPAASSCRPVPTFPMRAQMAFSEPDHPLFSPLVDGTTIQKPTHAMSRPSCLCLHSTSTSPQQVVPKYSSPGTGISRWLSMPAATSSTYVLVPLFWPNFSQNPRERHTVSPSEPSYPPLHPIIPFAHGAFPVSNLSTRHSLVSNTSSRTQPPASSRCAGVPCVGRGSFRESSDFSSPGQRSTAHASRINTDNPFVFLALARQCASSISSHINDASPPLRYQISRPNP